MTRRPESGNEDSSDGVAVPAWAIRACGGTLLTSMVGYAVWMTSVASDVRVIRQIIEGVVQVQNAKDVAQDLSISHVREEVKDVKGRVSTVESELKNKLDRKQSP